jgi:hypothetical protein
MSYLIEVKYFNSFILKDEDSTFHVEESRIKGDYNGKSVDYGVRAHITDESYEEETRENTLIYSGIYNSRTGVNNTNQFPIDKPITLSVDIQQGSIQKLFAENQVLNIFQEEKVRYVPINKDIIYTAEGVPLTTSANVFLGDVVSYGTNYGIGKNPESFTYYAGRKYFVDKPKGAVLRLSRDGITEISNYGMRTYFRDNLSDATEIHTVWDIYDKNLTLTAIRPQNSFTVAFDEGVNGWSSFYSYIPQGFSGSLDGKFYTFNQNNLYEHYATNEYNNFYGVYYDSSVDFIFNEQPSASKNFLTVNYEGSDTWNISNIETDTDQAYNIPAYNVLNEDLIISAFQKMHNKFYSNIMNSSTLSAGEVVFGNDVSGIKGFFAKMKIQTSSTDYKELFSVSTNYNINSY